MVATPDRPDTDPARRAARPRRPFDQGARRTPYTAADLEWAAAERNQGSARTRAVAPSPGLGASPEPDWDALAGEAMAQSRLDMGLCL